MTSEVKNSLVSLGELERTSICLPIKVQDYEDLVDPSGRTLPVGSAAEELNLYHHHHHP